MTAAYARWRVRPFRWYHGVLVVIMLAILAMWVYALVFAPRGNPNRLHDRAWAANAESVCAGAQAKIAALPAANTTKSPQERADVLDRADAVLADLIATLRTFTVEGTDKERHYVELWLTDYDTYLNDRTDWATVLHRGEDKPFAISKGDGGPILDRMDGFADANDMPSCRSPLDV